MLPNHFDFKTIFSIQSPIEFENLALKVFQFQAKENAVYKEYLHRLNIHPKDIKESRNIPFLPISFFKTHKVTTGVFNPEATFLSSTTTTGIPSKHFVKNLSLYEISFFTQFKNIYGRVEDLKIFALLPSYIERKDASLIYMVNKLMEKSSQKKTQYFLDNYGALKESLLTAEKEKKPYLLIGVSFALLDFVENHKLKLPHAIIMETGGMKGKRKEMIRQELHAILQEGFGVQQVHSEYGMTELLSQAYATKNGVFIPPPWMKVYVRKTTDPLSNTHTGRGALNIIDLANIYSCAFIATEDIGNVNKSGSFEVLGRFDNAEIRGCNLMVY